MVQTAPFSFAIYATFLCTFRISLEVQAPKLVKFMGFSKNPPGAEPQKLYKADMILKIAIFASKKHHFLAVTTYIFVTSTTVLQYHYYYYYYCYCYDYYYYYYYCYYYYYSSS